MSGEIFMVLFYRQFVFMGYVRVGLWPAFCFGVIALDERSVWSVL
jgi:hypothetical protein